MTLRIPYPMPLRPDFLATLELPDDMTVEEAERVCRYVRAIATDIGADSGASK